MGSITSLLVYLQFRIRQISAAARILAGGVVVAPRGGGLRVSPHFCNTTGELDLFLERLGVCIRDDAS